MKINGFIRVLVWLSFAATAQAEQMREVSLPVLTLDGKTTAPAETIIAAMTVKPGMPRALRPGETYSPEQSFPKIVFVVYADGRFVWSGDQIHGGRPLCQTKLDTATLTRAIARVSAKKYFGNAELSRVNFGPDASHAVLYVRRGLDVIEMKSWHELMPSAPPSQAFAAAWEDIKNTFVRLVPAKPVKPDPKIKVIETKWVRIDEGGLKKK